MRRAPTAAHYLDPFRIPGEPMDVPLLWDGYAMTRRGQAANALVIHGGRAGGGLLSAVIMVALSKPVPSIALIFRRRNFSRSLHSGWQASSR